MNPQSTLSAWMALLGMVVLVGLRGGEGGVAKGRHVLVWRLVSVSGNDIDAP